MLPRTSRALLIASSILKLSLRALGLLTGPA